MCFGIQLQKYNTTKPISSTVLGFFFLLHLLTSQIVKITHAFIQQQQPSLSPKILWSAMDPQQTNQGCHVHSFPWSYTIQSHYLLEWYIHIYIYIYISQKHRMNNPSNIPPFSWQPEYKYITKNPNNDTNKWQNYCQPAQPICQIEERNSNFGSDQSKLTSNHARTHPPNNIYTYNRVCVCTYWV